MDSLESKMCSLLVITVEVDAEMLNVKYILYISKVV